MTICCFFGSARFLLLLMICGTQVSLADHKISFEFLAYKNLSHRKANGQCCDYNQYNCASNGCDTEMLVCLKRALNEACIGGTKSSGVIGSAGSYIFHGPSNIGKLQNPLVYFGKTIPNDGFQLYIEILDKDRWRYELIDEIYVNVSSHPINSSTVHATGVNGRALILLAFKLNCFPTYYGSNCSTQCVPYNNHYTCDARTGEKRCLSGYQNPALNCLQRSCETYCNATGGVCAGSIPMCVCRGGWKGDDCSKPICQESCNRIGGYCDLPGECKCHESWTGENCGVFLCAPECSDVGGRCSSPGACECRPGYTGQNCEIDLEPCHRKQLCYNGGNCTNTGEGNYMCSCSPGFTEQQCGVDLDECATYTSLCTNNSRCLNYPGGYKVFCLPGWTGPDCCENINDCLPNTCGVHGLRCTDAVNGYFCSCQPGYEGVNCELLEDNCNPNPCLNNGTCESANNSYRCLCPNGLYGRDCETAGQVNHPSSANNTTIISAVALASVIILIILIIVVLSLIAIIYYRTIRRRGGCVLH